MLALIFPGQGCQETGMGRDVWESSPAARKVFEEADDALDLSMTKLCFEGPDELLLRTDLQQPAILTVSIALLRALEERIAPRPDLVAGHSLGEYTALVASGALAFDAAVRAVHARGRFMQEAVPAGRGTMAAIMGLTPEEVRGACEAAQRVAKVVVSPANFNAPGQTVIAGDVTGVELACNQARSLGARRCIPLPVSAPFHCELMQAAAGKLAVELAGIRFQTPHPPVVSNVDAEPNRDPGRIPELLERQVTAPVRFTEMIERMSALGVKKTLEIGPGRVLTGLVARTVRTIRRASLTGSDGLAGAESFIREVAVPEAG